MKTYHSKSLIVLNKAREILDAFHPMTVRQLYYRLVATEVIENNERSYKNLVSLLTDFRKDGLIPYDYFTDRTREPIKSGSWDGVTDFLGTVRTAYRRAINDAQKNYVEVWLEKDALAGAFEPVTKHHDLYLIVGRGYQSASALYEAAQRFKNETRPIFILYFGDFDPSGEDIYRDIQERLETEFNVTAHFEKVSLTLDDIQRYNLPPAPTKKTDTRSKEFVSKNGDIAVELDALPPNVLKTTIENAIYKYIDKDILLKEETKEKEERQLIIEMIDDIAER